VVALDQLANIASCNIDLGGFYCSTATYCTATGENLIGKIRNVETEKICKSLCRDTTGCEVYTWFSADHGLPEMPTPALSCFLFNSCDIPVPCEVCASGPLRC